MHTRMCVVNDAFEVSGRLSRTLGTPVGADACFCDKIQRKDVLNPRTDREPSKTPLRTGPPIESKSDLRNEQSSFLLFVHVRDRCG